MRNVTVLNAVFGAGLTMIKSNLSSSEIRHRIDHMAGSVYAMLGDIGVRAEGLLPHPTLKHIVKYRLLGGDPDEMHRSRSRAASEAGDSDASESPAPPMSPMHAGAPPLVGGGGASAFFDDYSGSGGASSASRRMSLQNLDGGGGGSAAISGPARSSLSVEEHSSVEVFARRLDSSRQVTSKRTPQSTDTDL